MRARFELFDHTADVGVRVWADSLAGLVAPAGDGLYAIIGRIVTRPPDEARTIQLEGTDPALLLRDYLAELLHAFDAERRQLCAVRVDRFDAGALVVAAAAREIDFERSRLEREVKAITYHDLEIRALAGGFEATYIVDI